MNRLKASYQTESFFSLNLDKLTVRGSMLPFMLSKELNIPNNSLILEWFDQDCSKEEKRANFKTFFKTPYEKLKYDYVDYKPTLDLVKCELILTKTHLNVEKTKNEILSKMIVFLSFLGNEIQIDNNQLCIDNIKFELDLFLDPYIATCNLLLSHKIKEATYEVYKKDNKRYNLNLFDCFIIKLHSNFIKSGDINKSEYSHFINIIQNYYIQSYDNVA